MSVPAELRGPHFRLCVRVADLEEPAVPSERRLCHFCLAPVWYDPKASIHPPTEIVTCEQCLEGITTDPDGPFNPRNWEAQDR